MLQVLDDGRLTDGKGRVVDFKNTVIIMTSNVGGRMLSQDRLGFESEDAGADREDVEKRLMDELRRCFRPEFLNRIDEIIVFEPLTREQLAQIVDLLLERLREVVKGQGMKLEVSIAARQHLAEQGYDAEYGARPLKRAIQRLLENPLSGELLRGAFTEGDTIHVDIKDGSLVFSR